MSSDICVYVMVITCTGGCDGHDLYAQMYSLLVAFSMYFISSCVHIDMAVCQLWSLHILLNRQELSQ